MNAEKQYTNNENTTSKEFDTILLEKTKKVCGLCENFSLSKASQEGLIAVMSCEGACLRGEISRRVANKLCFDEYPEITARVCLGGAFTKDTGQRNMVRTAHKVIALLEGCFIECASRMMQGVISDLKPEKIIVDKYYTFNKNLFAINDTTEQELEKFTEEALSRIKDQLNIQKKC